MQNDSDQGLEVELLAASVKLDSNGAKSALETLAKMLEAAVPERITINRSGWFLSKERPISELTVKFDEFQYQLLVESGFVSARSMKLVRGVALKTNELSIEDCIQAILKELSSLASRSASARTALEEFLHR